MFETSFNRSINIDWYIYSKLSKECDTGGPYLAADNISIFSVYLFYL